MYVEESLYLCADFIVAKLRDSVRMNEQKFEFDFNENSRRVIL